MWRIMNRMHSRSGHVTADVPPPDELALDLDHSNSDGGVPMRKIFAFCTLFALAAVAAGCYHATIDTGLAPSGATVERPWAHSFIAGLVPPSTVETAAQCPDGVARVETQLSFLNMVANAVTFGIYSPMTIRVSCAATRVGSTDETLIIPAAAPHETVVHAFADAVQRSRASGEAVFVQFE
jgi:hypothetical protein